MTQEEFQAQVAQRRADAEAARQAREAALAAETPEQYKARRTDEINASITTLDDQIARMGDRKTDLLAQLEAL